MARIRTIKPEFWTDATLTECSMWARLLFIGTWNFADDNGNFEDSVKQIKLKILPSDNVDVGALLAELIDRGVLIRYTVGDKNYLHIKGFRKHQVINRPSQSGCPPYECSVSAQGGLTEHSLREGKGKEGKGKEKTLLSEKTKGKTSSPGKTKGAIPYGEVLALYERHCLSLPKVRMLSEPRKKLIASRWKEHPDGLAVFEELFIRAERSDFLTGRSKAGDWSASFDWLLNPKNMVKVLEGNYDNRDGSSPVRPMTREERDQQRLLRAL